jgi:hypothetical protein
MFDAIPGQLHKPRAIKHVYFIAPLCVIFAHGNHSLEEIHVEIRFSHACHITDHIPLVAVFRRQLLQMLR